MEAENLVFNYGGKWQVIEKLCELFPDVCVTVLPQALIIETIYLCNLSTFVISSEDGQSIFEADLQSNKECYSLY